LFSLCVYKFNLFLLLPLYLVARRRWRVFWYALGGAAILAGGSFLLQSPRLYLEYLRHIPEMTISSGAAIMPGLRGLTSGWPAVYAVAAAGVAVAAFGAMRRADETLGLAIAITGSLLVAYHVVHYDLALLAIPIAVALAVGGKLAKAASMALAVGLPLWYCPPRYLAVVVGLLFVGLVLAVERRAVVKARV
jgi:hypothetical protein